MKSEQINNFAAADEAQHEFSMSTFANPPNPTSSSLLGHQNQGSPSIFSAVGYGAIELHYDHCLHIRAEGNRRGTLFLTPTYMIFEYEDNNGLCEGEVLAIEEMKKKIENDQDLALGGQGGKDIESSDMDYKRIIQHFKRVASLRPKSMRWKISELSHIYLRRYRLRDSSLEMFFIPTGGDATGGPGLASALSSILLDFGPGNEGNERRDEAANAIMGRAPTSTVKQWPEKSAHFSMSIYETSL